MTQRPPEEIVNAVKEELALDFHFKGPSPHHIKFAVACIEADRRERAAVKPPVPGWLAYIVSRDSAIRHRAEFPASAYDYDRGYLRALEMVIAREFDASAKEQPTPS